MSFLEAGQRLYFIGVGGIGMSALARLCKAKGLEVSGSDTVETSLTNELLREGVDVFIGHGKLPSELDGVVYSEAVPLEDLQLLEAEKRGLPRFTYFEALGRVAADFRVLALAGTHGKSTTTAMLGLILVEAGLDPTVLVGTKVREFGGSNMRVGGSDLFVVEACEYRRNFLPLRPSLLGVLNVEFDHMDYFKDFEDYRSAFEELAGQSAKVIWPDDFKVWRGALGVPGEHNRMNAGMAAALARNLGVSEEAIETALASFTGTWRRFERRGELNGAVLIDDYAHHPTEIRATLSAAREAYSQRNIVVVFEPHQYSRTIGLLEDFSRAFDEAKEVIIPSIYEVRDQETDKEAVSAESLAEKINEVHGNAHFIDGLDKTASYLKASLGSEDLLLVMGAGPVDALFEKLT